MTKISEDEFHSKLGAFIDYDNYEIKIAARKCDEITSENFKKIIEDLTQKGYEVFPHLVRAGTECNILYRIKR